MKGLFLYFWQMISHPKARVIRYIISGGLATVANFATLYSLTEYLHIWYMLSSIVALGVGFVVSFVMQKFWTFTNNTLERAHIQFQLHVALGLFNVVANLGMLYVIVEQLHLWYMIGQFISGVVLAVFNYTVYRFFIFHK